MSTLLHELQVYHEELMVQNHQLQEVREQLEQSRDQYADLYDFAPVGFLTLDSVGVIHQLNLRAASLLGKPRATLEGVPLMAYARGEHRRSMLDFLRRCREYTGGPPPTAALTVSTEEGERQVELICSPRQQEWPDRPNFLVAMVDVTERNRIERERRLAESEREQLRQRELLATARAEAADRFLATLSHELRTPLTPVLAALSHPKLLAEVSPELRQVLTLARRGLKLEVRLIDDLLDVTRIARDRFVVSREPVDVNEAIAEVAQMVAGEASRRSIDVVTRLDARAAGVHGDATRVRQVLWNLVNNAVKFTPGGGRIELASCNPGHDTLAVTVRDTGRGMDPALVTQLFERGPDGRVRPMPSDTGLGLGLAICQGIVQAHGGSIRADSEGFGRGSTFTITFPDAFAIEGKAVQGQPSAASAGVVPTGLILLVEDDEDTATMVQMLLEVYGYSVEVAGSVREAIRLAPTKKWNLLISDLGLPDGSGLELMHEVAGTVPHAIALSGFGTAEDIRQSLDAGFDEHLVKPVDMELLIAKIQHYCAAPSIR